MCDQISFTFEKATGVAGIEDLGGAKLETGSQEVLVKIMACKRDWSIEKEYWET